MGSVNTQVHDLTEEDRLRADFYGLLAALLARPPSTKFLATLKGFAGDDSPIGKAVGTLAHLAGSFDGAAATREFNRLFIGVGRGELLPFASYYLTGFLNEKPLAALRADMRRLGIGRAPAVKEPEDSAASLLEMMAGLIRGSFGRPLPVAEQQLFFDRHLGHWLEHFFADLEAAEGAVLYAPVGTMGRLFIEVEKMAFRMEAQSSLRESGVSRDA